MEERLIQAHNDGLLLGEQRAAARFAKELAQLATQAEQQRAAAVEAAWQAGYDAAMQDVHTTITPVLNRTPRTPDCLSA